MKYGPSVVRWLVVPGLFLVLVLVCALSGPEYAMLAVVAAGAAAALETAAWTDWTRKFYWEMNQENVAFYRKMLESERNYSAMWKRLFDDRAGIKTATSGFIVGSTGAPYV